MNFSGLDLNLLVALDALFAERSVSRAGERLRLSQSATSGALDRLRQAFGDPLLVQVGRTMTLTPLAERLVAPVREFLMQAEGILNRGPVFDPSASTGKLRLLMSDYAQTVVMTKALPRLQRVAPGVTIEIAPITGDNSELQRGEIDLALGPNSYLVPGHPSERLFEDEFICLAWLENKEFGRKLSLDTYLRLGHVAVRFGRQRQSPTFDEWFTRHLGYERRIEVVTTTFNLVPQLLVGTNRIATVHRRLALFYQKHLPLKIVPPPIEIPRFEQFMQWHRSRDHDAGNVWLRSLLKEAVAESPLTGPSRPVAVKARP
ncbi:MAG: LysR family transcriptional regulator [Acidobacteriia bacterium]|nr:LysR family transcriptional regulator [Terriglobia bacterium]MBV9742616.1 LysR family transcriptional regulator [Terriglobia bacterium]